MSKVDELNSGITQCLQNIEWMEAQLTLLKIARFSLAQPFLDQIGANWAMIRKMLGEMNSMGYHYRKERSYMVSKPEVISKVWNYPEMNRK